ncbi:Pyruvate dehydrogenase E1 component alpha subunit [invertebrate metagenome]|uniref:pyruvate dehydrogenase (acetyl-transferring) n=1 Tax=invertebrate metagenome TaxID=1711999 RepID=A0A484H4G1_9ZZZZ
MLGHSASVAPDDTDLQRNLPAPDILKKFYYDMLLIRRFEEQAGQLYSRGLITGFCHLYIGQEAVVVGLQANAEPMDTMITSYREHGHMLACGMDPRGVMAELTGRCNGYSKGKGGSMHMFSREKGFYGGHGIVGAQVPIGTGLGFAHHYRKDGGLCRCYMGDGAANQGQVYESFNMAALWKLPVLYVIENNRYSMGTAVERASAGQALYQRGVAYGIPGRVVNGMDVLAVHAAGVEATDSIRAGRGPFLLEMKTYRYRGHSMSDPAKYRSQEEVQRMRTERDPIYHLRQLLLKRGLLDEAGLRDVDRMVKSIVAAATAFAQDGPEPGPAELYTDVLLES